MINRKKYILFFLACVILFSTLIYARVVRIPKVYIEHGFLFKTPMTKERLNLLPVPDDLRNYFVLQSIDDTTNVIIGEFSGSRKMICLISDNDSDGKFDDLVEYYVDTEKYMSPMNPSSIFYTNLKDLKRQIIEGDIFKNNYSYKMNSLESLKVLINEKENIIKIQDGYGIQVRDAEYPSRLKGEYVFGKSNGRYNLVIATYYYEVYHTKIAPVIFFSVYCKNSKDPVVAEVVESLLRMVK